MDHTFVPSQTDTDKCLKCRYNQRAHTNFAQCETCPNIGPCEIFADMLMCRKCHDAEIKAVHEHQSIDKQNARAVEYAQNLTNQINMPVNKPNGEIRLDTDIFNAKTLALVDRMKAIDSDETIENKPYAKAEFAVSRIKELQDVIFRLKAELADSQNEQRATQVYLNQMANTLREEERAKLKVEDINYSPTTKKQPKPKTKGSEKAKQKKQNAAQMVSEANLWASKIGMPGTVIHMRMLAKNMTAEAATRTLAAELNLTVKD